MILYHAETLERRNSLCKVQPHPLKELIKNLRGLDTSRPFKWEELGSGKLLKKLVFWNMFTDPTGSGDGPEKTSQIGRSSPQALPQPPEVCLCVQLLSFSQLGSLAVLPPRLWTTLNVWFRELKGILPRKIIGDFAFEEV